MSNRTFISFKYPDEIHELTVIHPFIHIILAELSAYCWLEGFPSPVVTCLARTEKENEDVESESMTHPQLRAVDVRSTNFSEAQRESITKFLNQKFNQWAAVNAKGEKRLVVYHRTQNGQDHLHIQIHSKFALPTYKGMNK